MSRTCEICGKGGRAGTSIVRHGMPKKKGGIGLHTTGITRRRFLANVQRVRVIENGLTVPRRVCTTCIKSRKVLKA